MLYANIVNNISKFLNLLERESNGLFQGEIQTFSRFQGGSNFLQHKESNCFFHLKHIKLLIFQGVREPTPPLDLNSTWA